LFGFQKEKKRTKSGKVFKKKTDVLLLKNQSIFPRKLQKTVTGNQSLTGGPTRTIPYARKRRTGPQASKEPGATTYKRDFPHKNFPPSSRKKTVTIF